MSLLESLYLERAQLTDKLRKLDDLIALYEGRQYPAPPPAFAPAASQAVPVIPATDHASVPASLIPEPLVRPETPDPLPPPSAKPDPGSETMLPLSATGYPPHGTWKDKILFVLGLFKRPAVVAEIAARMLELEPGLSDKDLQVTIGQYCSLMGKNGELLMDKTEYRNKYALKNDIKSIF